MSHAPYQDKVFREFRSQLPFDAVAKIPPEAAPSLTAMVDQYVDAGGHAIFHGLLTEALRNFRTALQFDPSHVRAQMGMAEVLLTMGRWKEGFDRYECRIFWDMCPIQAFNCPRWNGEILEHGNLIIQTEQGFGDNIQFARYLPLVIERVKRKIYLSLPMNLADLFIPSNKPPVIIPKDGEILTELAAWVPLLSLPRIFGTTVDNVPPPFDFFPGEPLPVLNNRPPKVGLVWRTNRLDGPAAPIKNMTLQHFLPLAKVKGIEWHCLQLKLTKDERKTFKKHFGGIIQEERMTTFWETAKLVRELDLVITIDTAMSHLAGSVGHEVWNVLAYNPDWRYLTKREDCVWYKNMRLFRCPKVRDWDGVIALVKPALQKWVDTKTSRTIAVA